MCQQQSCVGKGKCVEARVAKRGSRPLRVMHGLPHASIPLTPEGGKKIEILIFFTLNVESCQ